MVDSMVEQLQSDMECEGLLACFHGLKPLDRQCFRKFVESDEPLTVDEVAAAVDRERSTAYRSVQRLLQTTGTPRWASSSKSSRTSTATPRRLPRKPNRDHNGTDRDVSQPGSPHIFDRAHNQTTF